MGEVLRERPFFFEIDPEREVITPIPDSFDETIAIDFIKNPARSDGPFIANQNFLVTFRSYETSVVRYDLKSNKLSDYFYDETDIKTDYQLNERGFGTVPVRVNLKVIDAAFKPNSDSIVYLLGNGKTKSNRFELSTLYEFDIVKK